QPLAGGDVPLPVVPRTFDRSAIEKTLTKRSFGVRTDIAEGMETALDIRHHNLTVADDLHLAFRNLRHCSDVDKTGRDFDRRFADRGPCRLGEPFFGVVTKNPGETPGEAFVGQRSTGEDRGQP